MKDPRTYECIDPSSVGQERKFFLGKHSGRGLLKEVMGDMIDTEETLKVLKALSEERKTSFRMKRCFREKKTPDDQDCDLICNMEVEA